ncbi:hypothetical protein GBAR_LOCUS22132 [Geodia barretti]|uniref:Uncharacterized protein n=1 Tax=Geodia barretti TaxID=519541 RepID=A0AA35X0K1_GEOBA|nr:hypothetical protein GBAR_LOCUS21045 [Geodia barretti]CAI8039714.1 hypothetical protein GBAR_LOCUS22132 [Geodia barretti]
MPLLLVPLRQRVPSVDLTPQGSSETTCSVQSRQAGWERWRRMPTWLPTYSVTTPAGSREQWWYWTAGTFPTWPACSAN